MINTLGNVAFGKCSKAQFGAVKLSELAKRARTSDRDGVGPMILKDNTTGNTFQSYDVHVGSGIPPWVFFEDRVFRSKFLPGESKTSHSNDFMVEEVDLIG